MTDDAILQGIANAPTHALLLTGDNGAEAAIKLTAQLLATEHLENHAYFREVLPDPEKASILIEQIRGLLSFFRLKVPVDASVNRVAILQSAHTMTGEAQNALLKLLEEPPEASVLILTSTQPQKLLPTIRSRLQLIRLASQAQTPDADTLQLIKQALAGTSYDRLLMVEGLKQREAAEKFVRTLNTVAMASLEAAARKGAASVDRWKSVLQAAHTAEDAFSRSGNTKLVLTELMLAI